MSIVDPRELAPADSRPYESVISRRIDCLQSAVDDVVQFHRADIKTSNYFQYKYTCDWFLAAMIFVVAMPVMVAIGVLILIFNGRPIFYRQQRVGKNGESFSIWKFRSMRPDAESTTGAIWSSYGDERVTLLGRWLRSSHLDELPQLFNVIAGQMSVIGPRPERPEFVRELAEAIPGYSMRHRVRPGITGLSQVSQGYDSNVHDVAKKTEYDLTYIAKASFWLDAKILFMTIPFVLREVRDVATRGWKTQVGQIQHPPVSATFSQATGDLESLLLEQIEAQRQVALDASNSQSIVPSPKLLEDRPRSNWIAVHR